MNDIVTVQGKAIRHNSHTRTCCIPVNVHFTRVTQAMKCNKLRTDI